MIILLQLDAKVAELIHEKSELSGRIEEDQDEIEEMMSKQRTQLHQVSISTYIHTYRLQSGKNIPINILQV